MKVRLLSSDQKDATAQKRAEEDRAWQEHSANEIINAALVRRSWLDLHLASQQSLCAYCSVAFDDRADTVVKDRRPTIDHIVPRSKGGANEFANTLAACAYCNTAKGQLSLAEYLIHPKRIGRLIETRCAPDRLSGERDSPYFDERSIERGVGVRFNGRERENVKEYCVSEGWILVRAAKSLDRHGRPVAAKLKGRVEAYFRDTQAMMDQAKASHKLRR